MEGEGTFDGLTERPISKERAFSRTRSTQSRLLEILEGTVCKQIASIPELVEVTVVKRFGDTLAAMKSDTDTKVVSKIVTAVKVTVFKTFQSATFYIALEQGVQKFVLEPYIVDAVGTLMIDAPGLTIPLDRIIKQEVERLHCEIQQGGTFC